jgi:hypothetical protein
MLQANISVNTRYIMKHKVNLRNITDEIDNESRWSSLERGVNFAMIKRAENLREIIYNKYS